MGQGYSRLSTNVAIMTPTGDVMAPSGMTTRLEYELIRPSDTNTYSIGDAINTSTSTPIALPLIGASISSGGGGVLTKIKVESNITALAGATLRLYFFNDTPASITADNVAMTITYANSGKRIFYVDVTFDSLVVGSDTVYGQADVMNTYTCAATTLYFTVLTQTAFTPTSGGKIKISASSIRLN